MRDPAALRGELEALTAAVDEQAAKVRSLKEQATREYVAKVMAALAAERSSGRPGRGGGNQR